MLISQVIEQARTGELSNLSQKGFDTNKVMSYINIGLIELYKRFNLRTEEAIITMRATKTIYKIDGTDSDVDMIDGIDVLSIMDVYDEGGAELSINVDNDDYSVLTPSFNTVQVPYPADGERISLIYSAGPTNVATETQILELPVSLLEALLHYIGYRAHGAIDGNVQAENNTHYQRFEASCKRATLLGVVTPDDVVNMSTQDKGFV